VQETVWVAQLLWSLGRTLLASHSWQKAVISVLIYFLRYITIIIWLVLYIHKSEKDCSLYFI
jgi:hypothetical protein